ncbi:MAG: hypothetical protein JNL01_05285 [Bdellovibrionales bacterium]|nr:hypothetical protein [Bdellovibrionales bacterium]
MHKFILVLSAFAALFSDQALACGSVWTDLECKVFGSSEVDEVCAKQNSTFRAELYIRSGMVTYHHAASIEYINSDPVISTTDGAVLDLARGHFQTQTGQEYDIQCSGAVSIDF